MNITNGIIVSAQKVVIYGPEGIGKSTLASHFPDPLFIDTEGSTKQLNVRRFDPPSSWQMLFDQVKYVIKTPELCKTLIIDTADWAEQLCTNAVLAQYKQTSIENFGYGKGYVYQAEEFGRLLNLLNEVINTGVHVVLTAHAKMRKFEQPDEMGAYDRWEMKLAKQVFPLVKEWADMILFCNYKTYTVKDGTGDNAKVKARGSERRMYTSHHACWDAKNRHNLPDELPMSFSQIAECFPSAYSLVEDPVPPAAVEANTKPVKKALVSNTDTTNTLNIPSELPKALKDLMLSANIDESEIRRVVALKGFYPLDTPISNYAEDFINGALIAGWDQMLALIHSTDKDIPF